jgi:hypothetical protein
MIKKGLRPAKGIFILVKERKELVKCLKNVQSFGCFPLRLNRQARGLEGPLPFQRGLLEFRMDMVFNMYRG